MRSRWPWLLIAVGLAAVTVAAVLLSTNRQLPPQYDAVPPASTPMAVGDTDHPSGAGTPAATSAPSSPPRTADPTPYLPTAISLRAFDVSARVTTAFTERGVLQPPSDPSVVGWWAAGSAAAAAGGPTVIVGHVDGPNGPGALYRLVHSEPGDLIVLGGASGRQTSYRVTSLHYYPKSDGLPRTLFDNGGPPRLVVISCGGTFDRADLQYEDNIVVQAVPST